MGNDSNVENDDIMMLTEDEEEEDAAADDDDDDDAYTKLLIISLKLKTFSRKCNEIIQGYSSRQY